MRNVFFIALLAGLITGGLIVADGAQLQDLAPQDPIANHQFKNTGRGPASVEPIKKSLHPEIGQAEQMLYSITESSPNFLQGNLGPHGAAHVGLIGACKNPKGQIFTSNERDYKSCLDSSTHPGATDSINSMDRAAGIGISIR